MKITLTQLRLQNFKGAKDQTIEFTDRTSIYGQNASGKTRIFDDLHGYFSAKTVTTARTLTSNASIAITNLFIGLKQVYQVSCILTAAN